MSSTAIRHDDFDTRVVAQSQTLREGEQVQGGWPRAEGPPICKLNQ